MPHTAHTCSSAGRRCGGVSRVLVSSAPPAPAAECSGPPLPVAAASEADIERVASGSSSVTSSHSGKGSASDHLRAMETPSLAARRRPQHAPKMHTKAAVRRARRHPRRRRFLQPSRVTNKTYYARTKATARACRWLIRVELVRSRELTAKSAHGARLVQLVSLLSVRAGKKSGARCSAKPWPTSSPAER